MNTIRHFSLNIILLLTITLSVALLGVSGCTKKMGDVEEIKALIEDVAQAAKKKDVKGAIVYFSDSYADDYGNNRDSIKRYLLYELLRKGKISIFIRSVDVTIDGERAMAVVNAVLARGMDITNIKELIPENSAGYRFTLILEKAEGDWLVVNASWDNVGVRALI